MNNEKEKAPLNKVEEDKSGDAKLNEIMFNLLKAVKPTLQLLRTELLKTRAELEETKAELKKAKSKD